MSTTPEFEGANEQGMNNPQGEHTQGSSQSEQTSAERAAEKAREGATAAASALRRGEFMHDAAVDPAADRDDKLIAMLAYVTQILIPFIMPVIILLSESSKKRPFQRYHAVQSLALTVVFTAFAAALAIGTAILQVIPLVGILVGFIVVCLSPIAFFMAAIALIYYGAQAYQGKRFGIPGLTSFLLDQGWLS